ncbi:histone-lysine N-methyltransferase SETMAR [Trichonephila clavipes]|uniref:Histone-lysine N-methyltransferase SETMAR n=1 Tax=Trichonephila clavipes TaxID=2585209 RepID=A0A8X6V0D1_TRICX|nr:histone-lysine N-methyltransferase SETMAR [Trichonephila clavipes]
MAVSEGNVQGLQEKKMKKYGESIFDVKAAPRTGRPVVENVDKIPEIIEVDRNVSNHSIAQELKIDHKTVLSHLSKVGFKKKLDVWVHQTSRCCDTN